MNNVNKQSVTDWAKEDLKYSVDADYKSQILLYGVCIFMLFLPVLFIYFGISEYLNGGHKADLILIPVLIPGFGSLLIFSKADLMLILGFGSLLIFGAVVGYVMFYYRRIQLQTLDKEGAEIRSGQKFLWSDLKYVNKILSKNRGNIILRRYELVFGNGKAFIPADLKNIEKMEVLLALIPTEKRLNGKISEA